MTGDKSGMAAEETMRTNGNAEHSKAGDIPAGQTVNAGRKARIIAPGASIGVLGGGQLGRMMALAGAPLGYRFVALDPAPEAPCGQVAAQIVAAYSDKDAAAELAERTDVITYEFENVDAEVAALLEERSYVPQGSRLLYTTQHRLREKAALEAAGATVAPYAAIGSEAELDEAVKRLGTPCVLKTATGGYDGKGQFVIRNGSEVALAYAELSVTGAELVLEQFISFRCEISVIAARSSMGETSTFPPAENIHRGGILHASIVPARVPADVLAEAERLAARIAESFGAVGLLAVEMFYGEDGRLYVNEVAPRPHNSGHYTMEACATSQFEQHVRAICGLPLGSPELRTPVVMVNVLGEHLDGVTKLMLSPDSVGVEPTETAAAIRPKFHLYGKDEAKTGRKMGHINLLCGDTADALAWIDRTGLWPVE
ncbi:5-(carboxyamino)imidazole ribonucleotide synthase [Saccharibacillus kuerlensis]|uniref:N5-carboxyaminoimidazole ribonucleotide synthase n=1 Tax=Saccharibacillus kuerlensis TaxID=459527 RepID=A0ABQ2LAS2_9BACL|nr:5-(carboxyamino)imidazole ribonucleotide synthase [Saccharibacillus kuerlensis]GGO06888.1 N5-carboxyaminoimidazole ribonucleotide synthase [Saccharibacillus kuerlensis]